MERLIRAGAIALIVVTTSTASASLVSSAHEHDILYVLAGTENSTTNPLPTDNFNGITVAGSAQTGGTGIYDRVATFNTFTADAFGDRTSTCLGSQVAWM